MSETQVLAVTIEASIIDDAVEVRLVEETYEVDLVGPGAVLAAGYANQAAGYAAQAEAAVAATADAADQVISRASYTARIDDGERLFSFLDSNRREIAYINRDGRLDINQTELRIEGWTIKERFRLEAPTGKVAVLSSNYRLLGYLDPSADASIEVQAARGDRDSLDARLSQSLSDYGSPKRYYFNEHKLRQVRYKLRKRMLAETQQLSIACIGDSYTHNATRWTGAVASSLVATYGDAGGGWLGFGSNAGTLDNGNVRPSSYVYSRSGTWTYTAYYTSPSPDLAQITSSTAASKVTVTGPATPTLSAVTLFWIGTADGVVRYRWNGGAWTSLNVQGTVGNLSNAALSANMPASGAWTLEIEVVSGTVTLAGLNIASAASGVVVHKLGSTGSTATQWAAVNAAQWQAGITALNPNAVIVMLATNDQGGSVFPGTFATNLTTIITRLKAAVPVADIVIAMPPENNRPANTYPMASYTAEAATIAAEQGCAFLDLQYVFGDTPSVYAATGALPLFNVDLIHPEPTTGGRVIVDAVMRLLTTV